jgi:hypothetical protein
VRSPQTLSEDQRRVLAFWAADCAERVLPLFEAERPDDPRPREAIQRTRAFALGELDTATAIRLRFGGGAISKADLSAAAYAAARAAGQASAVCHMGAHALGAAAYVIEAVEFSAPDQRQSEMDRLVDQLTPEMLVALKLLPAALSDRSGPLGPGLITSGRRGEIIAALQKALR